MMDVDLILARPYRLSDRPIVRRTRIGGRGRKLKGIPAGFRDDVSAGMTKAALARKYGLVYKTTSRMFEEITEEEAKKNE